MISKRFRRKHDGLVHDIVGETTADWVSRCIVFFDKKTDRQAESAPVSCLRCVTHALQEASHG